MSTPVDALFFVNFATVLNKYLGLCLFCSKRDKYNLAVSQAINCIYLKEDWSILSNTI